MLTAGDGARDDLGEAIARDPRVRQARALAELARRRLRACVSMPSGAFDPAEAQRFLDNFNAAQRLAEDAEDRVLAHFGRLTPAQVTSRAARRRTAVGELVAPQPGTFTDQPDPVDRLPRPPASTRRTAAQVAKNVLVPIAAGLAGVALARRGLRR